MKVYKIVTHQAVEQLSFDGWELVQMIPSTRVATTLLKTPVAAEGCGPPYNGASPTPGYVGEYNREEAHIVSEPLFMFAKDVEVITREVKLKDERDDFAKKSKAHEARADQLARDHYVAAGNLEREKHIAAEWKTKYIEETELRRKLEADLAKVRTAFGSKAFEDAVKP